MSAEDPGKEKLNSPTCFGCMKIIADLKRALARFIGGENLAPSDTVFCLSVPSYLGLSIPLSPTTLEELNLRADAGWKKVLHKGAENRLPGIYVIWQKGGCS